MEKLLRPRVFLPHQHDIGNNFVPMEDDEEQERLISNSLITYVIFRLFNEVERVNLTEKQDHTFRPGEGNWPEPEYISNVPAHKLKAYKSCYAHVAAIERVNSALPGRRGPGPVGGNIITQGSEERWKDIQKWCQKLYGKKGGFKVHTFQSSYSIGKKNMSSLFRESGWVYTGPGGDIKADGNPVIESKDEGVDGCLGTWKEVQADTTGVRVKEEMTSVLAADIHATPPGPGGSYRELLQRQQDLGPLSHRAKHTKEPKTILSRAESDSNLDVIWRHGDGRPLPQETRAYTSNEEGNMNPGVRDIYEPKMGAWQKFHEYGATSCRGNDETQDDNDVLTLNAKGAKGWDKENARGKELVRPTRNQTVHECDIETEKSAYQLESTEGSHNLTQKHHLEIDRADGNTISTIHHQKRRRIVDPKNTGMDSFGDGETSERDTATFHNTTYFSTADEDRSYAPRYRPDHNPGRSADYVSRYSAIYTPDRPTNYVSPYRPLKLSPTMSQTQTTPAGTFAPTHGRELLDFRANCLGGTTLRITAESSTQQIWTEQSLGPSETTETEASGTLFQAESCDPITTAQRK